MYLFLMKLHEAEPHTSLRSNVVSSGVLRTQDLLENQRFYKALLRGTHTASRGEIATRILPFLFAMLSIKTSNV